VNDTKACRHCSGLCAGKASKCHYCKRELRREPYTFGAERRRR